MNARRFRLAISHSYRTLRAIKSVYETGAGPVEAMRSLPAGAILPATADVSLPSSVQQAIVRRLDQLTKNARRLVAVAAAIGRDFDFRLMVRAAGLPEAAATEAVEELVRRHIFQGQGDRFAFIHHRVREVMYSRLLAPRRRMVHREIAEALETLYRANLEPHVEALGLHYHQGEIWHKAIGYLRAAARTAAAHAAYREATAYLDRALMCARHLPDERETGTLAIDLRVDLSRSLLALGEVPRLFDILREAETLVKALEDPRRLGRVWAAMAQYFLLVGQPERAVEMGECALATAQLLGDAALEGDTNYRLGQAYRSRGEYREGVRRLIRNIDLLGRSVLQRTASDLAESLILSRIELSFCHAELGEMNSAIATAEESLRLAKAMDRIGVHLKCIDVDAPSGASPPRTIARVGDCTPLTGVAVSE